jgi:hypothetical protein
MKTVFIGPIRDQLSSNKVLLWGMRTRDASEKTTDPEGSMPFKGIKAMADGIDFMGNDFRIPVHMGRNQGVGTRVEGATLPAPGNQGYLYITDTLKYNYGLFQVTGPLLRAAKVPGGAFERAMTSEMKRLTDDLKRKINIDAWGSGNGVLTTVGTGAASATQTLTTTVPFAIGDVLNFYAPGFGTIRNTTGPRTVLAVTPGSLTITLDASVTTTTGDVIVRSSTDSTGAAASATINDDVASGTINGLTNIIAATGALHGLNPATAGQGFWAASTIAAGGAIIGETLLRQLKDTIGLNSGSDEDLVWITTRGVRTRYAGTLTSLKRFTGDGTMKLEGGFKALLFDDQPMVYDDQAPVGKAWGVNTEAMFWSQSQEFDWLDEDGDVLKWNPRTDSWIGILAAYHNLGTFARNRHGVITGGADDTR